MKLYIVALMVILFGCAETSFRSSEKAGADNKKKSEEQNSDTDVKECVAPIDLPAKTSGLKEKFNWKATGLTSTYNQVLAAPTVAKLRTSDKFSSILTVAFKDDALDDNARYSINGDGSVAYAIAHDGQQIWASSERFHSAGSLAIADIMGNSDAEIVGIGQDYDVKALDANGNLIWKGPVVFDRALGWLHYVPGVSIADVDRDGKADVIVKDYVLDGETGAEKFRLSSYPSLPNGIHGFLDTTFAADMNNDENLEIVSGTGIYAGESGAKICAFPQIIAGFAVAQMRAKETFKTVIGNAGDGSVIAYRGSDCTKLFQSTMPGGGGGPINIADFDGDKELEFGLAGKLNYATFETDGQLKWKLATQDASSQVTGSTAFDFNGDGKLEIVYNDETKLRIFAGSTGKIHYEQANTTGTLVEYPVIADIDGDGHANLIVNANDVFPKYHGPGVTHGIRVFEAPNNNWMPTRQVWNQHLYAGYNISDSGKVANISSKEYWFGDEGDAYLLGFRNNPSGSKTKKESKCPTKDKK